MQRRDFLTALGLVPLTTCLPSLALAVQSGANYDRLLVLVELKGGNDGLNTVVPYADETYYRLRPRLAIKRDEVLQLDTRTGMHPALQPLLASWQAKELAIVQGVGYPEPNLSHFRSIEIWDTASKSNEYLSDGWLTRAFSAQPAPKSFAADGVVVGSNDMGPLSGTGARTIALSNTEQFLRQARLAVDKAPQARNAALAHILKTEADIVQAAQGLHSNRSFQTEFPKGQFGNALKTAAQIMAGQSQIAVLRVTLNGFDTHSNQPGVHQRLLKELAEGLSAFRSALQEIGLWDRTLIMTYAEFGRRPQENASMGTDHGTANVHFVLGGRVKGGLYGAAPDLARLQGGNLPFAVDFRSLYATALETWWGVRAEPVLQGRFPSLNFLRA